MGRLNILLLSILSLAIVFAARPTLGAEPEHVYIEGNRGHFRVEPGKVYHWKWRGIEKAPEPRTPAPEKAKPEAGAKAVVAEKPGARITREAVEAMVREFETLSENKDVDGLARLVNKYYSPDFIMFLTVETAQGKQSLRLDRDGYIKSIKEVFSLPKLRYEYEVKNLKVDISEDGRSATSEADLHEAIGTKEQRVSTVTHQIVALELKGGQLLITKVSAVTK